MNQRLWHLQTIGQQVCSSTSPSTYETQLTGSAPITGNNATYSQE